MSNIEYNSIFSTDNYLQISKACQHAKDKSRLYGIIGYTGAGKTTALKHYSKKNDNVTFIERKKSMRTKEFYQAILLQLNPNAHLETSIYNILNQIEYIYKSFDEKCLLIIDEAGKLRASDLEYLHELRERTIDNLGIIIAGPEYYFNRLKKWKAKNVVGVPELYRRIMGFVKLDRPKISEVRAICNGYEIKNEKLIKNWHKQCENFGEIMNEIIKYREGVAEGENEMDID